jgi:carbon-monoxide dehydrogenase large subunit
MVSVALRVNGRSERHDIEPRLTLADFLRHTLRLTGTHVGCEHGVCGACTVMVNGLAVRSCLMFAVQADGADLVTVEGLAPAGELSPLQRAFHKNHALQCGFCTPGMLITAQALIDSEPYLSAERIREVLSGNLCRCTGYVPIVEAVLEAFGARANAPSSGAVQRGAMMDEGGSVLPSIGRALPRFEDARFLSGRGSYVDDLAIDGMVFAAVLRSSAAHARIRSIDTDAARAMPGVHAIFTGRDLDPDVHIPMRATPLPGYGRAFLQPPLAIDKVRYVGEPVAFIVADSPYRAEDALEQIEVNYEALPAVTDWHSANGASVLHEQAGTNIASHYKVGRGNPAASPTADYVRSERLRCHRHSGMPLETRGLLAQWDDARQQLKIWGAAKVAFANRRILGGMLRIPEAAIDLIEVDIGGGFGVRGEFYPEDFLVAFAARALRRPVKWIEDRHEHMMATNHSREVDCDLTIACRRDGTILALSGKAFVDLGAYVRTNGGMAPSNVAAFLAGPYRIADFSCEMNVFTSNKTPIGSVRGPGRYEANFFRERMIDIAARDLGLDPAEMRRRNLIAANEMPYNPGALIPNVAPSPYDSGDYAQTLTRVLDDSRWSELEKLSGQEIDGWHHGVGLSCFVESGGAGPRETARLRLIEDGGLELISGCSTLGQGHETTFAQICADALGVAPDGIRVFHGSTTDLDEGFGTYGGRTAVMGGSAILDASRAFIEQARAIAVDLLGKPNEELVWRDGAFCTADASRRIGLEELGAAARARGLRLDAFGAFDNTKLTYSYGANVAHVAVDIKTGAVKVLGYWAVEDVGRIINPLIVHGQMVGGVVQGLGGAFLDEFIYDEDGQLLNASFADYLLPTAGDFPNIHCVSLENARSTTNPLGVKAAGEGGIVAVAATVANAVSAALVRFGGAINTLPVTPVRVWQAAQAAATGQFASTST